MEKMDEDEEHHRLQELVETNPDDPSHHFNLGLFLWGKGAENFREKAAQHFLTAAKLNPKDGSSFRLLGHYYINSDSQRAFKCYQRALTLSPDDSESGEALCDLLDKGGKESLEVVVCRDASEKSPRAFWAFRRLGYLLVHQNKWSEAVHSLQYAIRGYPTCADLWEALGLAYQTLGMFTAAIKSYGRAIELEEKRVFALIESGNVFLMLGSFRKGVEQFRQALEIVPQNVSAHYGLASGLLSLSKEWINSGAFRWGASALEEASKVAKAGTYLAGNISCIWKLHADIQLSYAKCFPWMVEGLEIDEEVFSTSVVSWKRSCYLAALSATTSYQRALHLNPSQANIYIDIAITSDLIRSLEESCEHDLNEWQLSEKMSLGGLLLEGWNYEFWVALGCLSGHVALKQHAFIRGLQLDVSLAVAWAYLGKLYREEGDKQLAMQAFDRSRSIDPLLALPWAGMSADAHARKLTPEEAYESCLRCVQILPHAEFQLGLTKLALHSGHLSSPLVFGAIEQAVQRAPECSESHNLNGLVCEARSDYESAAVSYRLARYASTSFQGTILKSHLTDISINLARSLSRAGNALEAVKECEVLQKEGLLDAEGLKIYILSLWEVGKNEVALSVVRTLAASIPNMEPTWVASSTSFICRLLYYISGHGSAINTISRMPKELFQSSKVSFVVSAINALDENNRLDSVVSTSRNFLASHEDITRMHFLIALGKLVKHGSLGCLGIQKGIDHLRKFLHMYPNSSLIRNLLGYLLMSNKERKDTHVAARCISTDPHDCSSKDDLKSANEIFGAGGVACYASANTGHKFSFPTCGCHYYYRPGVIHQLQKWLRKEPWNHNARYLLILNSMQKAREENFPHHLCVSIERLIFPALADQWYTKKHVSCQYQKLQLLLCASEICLRRGDLRGCITHAKDASALSLPNEYLFFAHLLLCRAYATQNDFENMHDEYRSCLKLKTVYPIGLICLQFIESLYKCQTDSNDIIEWRFEELVRGKSSYNMWKAIFDLVRGLSSLWDRDFISAEEFLSQSCLSMDTESCLFLCHGVICMELARQQHSSQLSNAARSLTKAQRISDFALPFVSALLAQAEGSLGSILNWEKNLRCEWLSWPQEMRPAELFFQMHLLTQQPKDGSTSAELRKNTQRWIHQAIHLNPSCLRYWKLFQKLFAV